MLLISPSNETVTPLGRAPCKALNRTRHAPSHFPTLLTPTVGCRIIMRHFQKASLALNINQIFSKIT